MGEMFSNPLHEKILNGALWITLLKEKEIIEKTAGVNTTGIQKTINQDRQD